MDSLSQERSESQQYSIYALIDPRDKNVRYVGMSKQPYQRFGQHLAMLKDNPAKDAWIQELVDEDLIPELVILESRINGLRKAQEREGHWIQYYLDNGAPLLNVNLPKNVIADVTYHKFVDMAFLVRGLTNMQFRILVHVARDADQSRRGYSSIDLSTLALSAECSERYTRETLRELEEKHLIVAKSKTGGRGKATIYDITLPNELIETYKKTHKKRDAHTRGKAQDKVVDNHWDQLFER